MLLKVLYNPIQDSQTLFDEPPLRNSSKKPGKRGIESKIFVLLSTLTPSGMWS